MLVHALPRIGAAPAIDGIAIPRLSTEDDHLLTQVDLSVKSVNRQQAFERIQAFLGLTL